MRLIFEITAICLLCTSSAVCQVEHLSPKAEAALLRYQAAIQQARVDLIEELKSQRPEATRKEREQLDAMIEYITNMEQVPQDYPRLRAALDGTKWTWNKYDRPTKITLTFEKAGTYVWNADGKVDRRAYRTIYPRSLVTGTGDGQFLFDSDLKYFVFVDFRSGTVRTGTRID